jgi:16S rRNA (cytosine967-C5)-methyltransferase
MQRARKFPQLFPSPLDVDGIEDRDLALAHAIDQAVARRWLTLVAVLQAKLDRPWARIEAPVQATLLVGAAQLLLMERVPDHAVINEAVDWIKHRRAKAAAMVNAVLRRVAELRGEKKRPGENRPGLFSPDLLPLHDGCALELLEPVFDEDPLLRLAQQTSHPPELLSQWVERAGFDKAADLARHGLVHPPIILTGPVSGTVGGCEPHEEPGFAVLTGSRASLGSLLAKHPGLRVQDPSSAAAVTATADQVPGLIVELCAGKGTQTRQLAEVHPQAFIIASDGNPGKMAVLRETFTGHDRVRVVEPDRLIDHAGQADLVVVDAPCSNTGVLARRVEARYRCTPDTLATLAGLQRQILVEALRLRGPGGRILYCTCSIEPQENEQQIQWLQRWHGVRTRHQAHLLPTGQPGEAATRYRDGGYFAIVESS